MTTDFRALLEDLVEEVLDANQYIPPGVQSAIARARAALTEPQPEPPTDEKLLQIFDAACLSEGGTTDEIHLRGLRAVLARRPAPEPPAEGEVEELAAWLLEGGEDAAANGWDRQARHFGRAAELLQRLQPGPPTKAELKQLFDDHSGYINDEQVMWWSDFHAAIRAVFVRRVK